MARAQEGSEMSRVDAKLVKTPKGVAVIWCLVRIRKCNKMAECYTGPTTWSKVKKVTSILSQYNVVN